MSSRFARAGTRGYRWPKVCVSRPPITTPQPICAPMPADPLYYDLTINDATVAPPIAIAITRQPAPNVLHWSQWDGGATPAGFTAFEIFVTQSPGGLSIVINRLMQGWTAADTNAGYTTGNCYDSGPQTVRNVLTMSNVGTIRIYS